MTLTSVAGVSELSLEALPVALMGAGARSQSPSGRGTHRLLPAEAGRVGRPREVGLEVPTVAHLLQVEGLAGIPGNGRLETSWHGECGQVGWASGRWRPRDPGPTEDQHGQEPVGKPGSLQSA